MKLLAEEGQAAVAAFFFCAKLLLTLVKQSAQSLFHKFRNISFEIQAQVSHGFNHYNDMICNSFGFSFLAESNTIL